ncbi:hypothetical protein ABT072_46310 [Streptomyces sp. NPDC002589]|uniref:hypothetical protein n=1 Tax=Streptomyces sp. NPDC002589 TaxID=3154420 RepID=UPI0033258471
MNLALSDLVTAVRAALTPFVINPTAGTLRDLSRAMSKMTSYADSAASDREIPGFWIDSYYACDHAHEHIQNVTHTFTTDTAPTPLDIDTVKYAVLAATAIFEDAARNDTPPPTDAHGEHNPGPEHEFSVFGIARAAAHLLGTHWHAEPGLHGTSGLIQHSDGEDYLLAVGDVGDMSPELYVQYGDTRHVLSNTGGKDLPTLAQHVADTIGVLGLA